MADFKDQNLEIVHYYCVFCSLKSTKPKLNLSAKNVNLFLREPLGISKGQLASLLSTTPETLSRILAQMAAKNLIEVMRRDITILDLEGLKELAEHGKSIA